MFVVQNEWKANPKKIRRYGNYIDNNMVIPAEGTMIERKNPANNELIATWPASSKEDVDSAVAKATEAFEDGRWSGLTAAERAEIMLKVSAGILKHIDSLALIEVQETGKTLEQARGEVEFSSDMWSYAAGSARSLHGDSHTNVGQDKLALVVREPVGPVALIIPWNYPLVVLCQKLPYALAAGCTVVVKPSEFTSGTALELAKILEEAGVPRGVYNVVTGYGDPVGQTLACHTDIRQLSFTGSTATGQKIIQSSSSNMKKVVLELGGKNPTIVFGDANIEAAIDGAIRGFIWNSGAECCSGSRLYVQRPILESFTQRLIEKLKAVTVGDPLDPEIKMGAINNKQQFDKICSYIQKGKETSTLAFGGNIRDDLPGIFIEPTVFTNVSHDDVIAREEIFGPVCVIIPFDDTTDAIKMANDTQYGLASSIWTSDLNTSLLMSRAIRSGIVWVNTFLDIPTEIPLGGIKQSGYGRENGRVAIEEYTTTKTIVIQDPSTSGRFL